MTATRALQIECRDKYVADHLERGLMEQVDYQELKNPNYRLMERVVSTYRSDCTVYLLLAEWSTADMHLLMALPGVTSAHAYSHKIFPEFLERQASLSLHIEAA